MSEEKIYRRSTQERPKERVKRDEKKRRRNRCINFHVTQEEYEMINERVALSGLHKSDFFINSCLYQKIVVHGNVRVFSEMRSRIDEIVTAVNRNPNLEDLSVTEREALRSLLDMMNVFQQGVEDDDADTN